LCQQWCIIKVIDSTFLYCSFVGCALIGVIFIPRNLSHEKPGIFLSSKISDTLIIPALPPTSKQGLCANAQNIMTSSKDDSSENSNTYFDSKYAMKRSIQVVEPEQEVGMHE
jgi:hypothetical protein